MLKLEVGKFYKNGLGHKIEILAMREGFAIGLSHENGFPIRICPIRKTIEDPDGRNMPCIIEEWQEPVVINTNVHVYKTGNKLGTSCCTYLAIADDSTEILASIPIKIDLCKPAGHRIWECEF